MKKIVTKGGICATKRKAMGFQFVCEDGKCTLGGSFGASGGKVAVTDDDLPEKIGIGSSYAQLGCKLCGNTSAYVCPSCGAVVCDDGKDKRETTCPSCGNTLRIEKVSGGLPKATVKPISFDIAVSSPHYDDIGEVLRSLGVKYDTFARKQYDCHLLFLNCGTSDSVQTDKLRMFVQNGGCLYASDQTDTIIDKAFPKLFDFGGHSGNACRIQAAVVDPELKAIVGDTIEIEFDLGAWATLKSAKGTTLMTAARGNPYAGLPLMVKVPYGNGTIFYTCFHNHAQASEKEKALLQLLVLKQIGASSKRSIEEVGAQMGIRIDKIKAKFQ